MARPASWWVTTTPRLLTFGDEPRHVDIRGWRYGPRRLRVNDDDDDTDPRTDTDTGCDVTRQRERTLQSLCRPVLDFCVCVCIAAVNSSSQIHDVSIKYVVESCIVQACSEHEPPGRSADCETVQGIQEVGGFCSRVDGICQLWAAVHWRDDLPATRWATTAHWCYGVSLYVCNVLHFCRSLTRITAFLSNKVNSAFHPSGVGKSSTSLHGWD